MKISYSLVAVLLLSTLTQCSISRQAREMQNFGNSKFRLVSVDSTSLAGVKVDGVNQLSDLNLVDKARIVTAYTAGSLPLKARLNLKAHNPTANVATLNELDYIVLIDGNEVAKGTSTERVSVPPGDTVAFSLPVSTDVRQLLSKEPRESIANFALGLADLSRKPTRMTLKVRPTFVTGTGSFKLPGYVSVNKDFNVQQ